MRKCLPNSLVIPTFSRQKSVEGTVTAVECLLFAGGIKFTFKLKNGGEIIKLIDVNKKPSRTSLQRQLLSYFLD